MTVVSHQRHIVPHPTIRARLGRSDAVGGGMKLIIMFVGLVSLATAASAQQYNLSLQVYNQRADKVDRTTLKFTPVMTRTIYSVATCLVGQGEEGPQILSFFPEGAKDRQYILSSAFWSSCGDREFTIGVVPMFMRGVAAEILYKRHFGGKKAARPQKIFEWPADTDLRLGNSTRAALPYIRFGECVAAANPEGVRSLLFSSITTPEEQASFATLRPAMGICVPAEMQIKMSNLLLRGFLAEGAYRSAATLARQGQAN